MTKLSLSASKKTIITLLITLTLLLVLVGLSIPPIFQPDNYNDFADQRSWLGIKNAWNVLSNIPFALVGIWGVFLLVLPNRIKFQEDQERWLWMGVSIGLILTAIGSGYYHWAPDNNRLVWDRIPMTIIFMSYVAALLSEKTNVNFGMSLWPLLLGVGLYSVLLWHANGDLRLYLGVQLFTVLVTLLMLPNWNLVMAILFFGLARVFEIYDHQIYQFTGNLMSGHTLKHFSAAFAGFWLIRMISKRKPDVFTMGHFFHH